MRKSFRKQYQEKFDLNMLGAHCGIFFTAMNLYFACGKDPFSAEGKQLWDTLALGFTPLMVLNTVLIPFFQARNAAPLIEQSEETVLLRSSHEDIEQVAPIDRYKQLIFKLADSGTMNGGFNTLRFSPSFVHFVRQDEVKYPYAAFVFFISALPTLVGLLQKKYESNRLLTAVNEMTGLSGVWVGGIFSAVLMQFSITKKVALPEPEVFALAGSIAGLFFVDVFFLYFAMLKIGSLTQVKNFFNSALTDDDNVIKKCLWKISFVLEAIRTAIGVMGNIMIIPLLLSISQRFNNATDEGYAKTIGYLGLIFAGLCLGVERAYTQGKPKCLEQNRLAHFDFASPKHNNNETWLGAEHRSETPHSSLA